jgi:predicted transcriptional regulator
MLEKKKKNNDDNNKDWNWIEYRKNKDNYVKKYNEEKENAILEIIRIYTIKEGGISQSRLEKQIDLDRKNLKPSIEILIKKGLVKKEKERGLHGKYFSTEKAYKDPLLFAYFFADIFRHDLLKQENLITTTNRIEEHAQPFLLCRDFTTYRHYFEPKFTEKHKLERTLFEFSNRIGAFITYGLIQAMNPDNYNEYNLGSAQEQDTLVREWIHRAVLRALPFIIWQFRDSIYKGINQYPKNYEEEVKYMDTKPKFVLDKKIITELTRSFARIYPLVNYEFQKIFRNLFSEVEQYKSYVEEIKEKWKKQEKCEHEYGQPRTTIFGFCGKECNKIINEK